MDLRCRISDRVCNPALRLKRGKHRLSTHPSPARTRPRPARSRCLPRDCSAGSPGFMGMSWVPSTTPLSEDALPSAYITPTHRRPPHPAAANTAFSSACARARSTTSFGNRVICAHVIIGLPPICSRTKSRASPSLERSAAASCRIQSRQPTRIRRREVLLDRIQHLPPHPPSQFTATVKFAPHSPPP